MNYKVSDTPAQWKEIEGFNGKYFISNTGLVKNDKGTYLKGSINVRGIKVVYLQNKNRKGKGFAIHRLVAEYFVPNPRHLKYIVHVDGDRLNNKASNLEWSETYSYISHLKLNDDFYDLLHKIEEKYGSIADAPRTDPNVIELQYLVNKS